MRSPRNLGGHELIGLEVQIVASPRESEIGLRGIIKNETMKTLTIYTPKRRIIEKKERKLYIKLGETHVLIDGSVLVGRPEERLKNRKWRRV